MDPLTALSLAGNILQFAEFGGKLLKDIWQVFRRGELESSFEAATLARDMHNMSAEIVDQCLAFRIKASESLPSSVIAKPEKADPLLDACFECQAVADLIRSKIESIKPPKSNTSSGKYTKKWRLLYSAMLQIWSRGELDQMTVRLESAKRAIETRVLVSLSTKMDFMIVEQSERFKTMSEENRRVITSLLKGQAHILHSLRSEVNALSFILSRAEVVLVSRERGNRKFIADALLAASDTPPEKTHPAIASAAAEESRTRRAVAHELISSLKFASIRSRFEAVDEAHRETFKWIFESPESQDGEADGRIWSDFSGWLRSGSGIYWINGKPASGKSTLMKFIISNPATSRLLSEWASDFPAVSSHLCTAHFFFWLSGTKEQRTLQGLLRSILYEICSQFPHLLPAVFPEEWSRRYYQLVRPDTKEDDKEAWSLDISEHVFHWSLSTLKAAALRLMSQTQYPLQICLFIDGLDEYEGDETEIARLFRQLSDSPNVKCCVSSRPHQPFIDAFSDRPTLRLQDFTYPDIVHYVSDQLNRDERWGRISADHAQQAQELAQEIVGSAQGVFLWVKLVVVSLLRGLGNWDSISDLQQRLRRTPKELEGLYEQMIFKVDDVYRDDSSRIFRSVYEASELGAPFTELTLLQMFVACKADFKLASVLDFPGEFLDETRMEPSCQDMRKRVVTRCGGLLEIQRQASMQEATPGLEISYLHRTVKEYLHGQDRQSILQARTDPRSSSTFKALHGIFAAYVLHLTLDLQQTRLSPEHATEDVIRNAMRCLYIIQSDDEVPKNMYVRLCDKIFGLTESLSWQKEGVRRDFPPRRPREAIAVEHRLHTYLRHLLSSEQRQDARYTPKAMNTLLEVSISSQSFEDVETVRVLLEFGADINAAWTRWIQFHSRTDWYNLSQAREILRFFMQSGAGIKKEEILSLKERVPEGLWAEIEVDPVIRQLLKQTANIEPVYDVSVQPAPLGAVGSEAISQEAPKRRLRWMRKSSQNDSCHLQ